MTRHFSPRSHTGKSATIAALLHVDGRRFFPKSPSSNPMQTSRLLLTALSSAFASLLLAPASFAQGALTPPGAPAPIFKTLDQIEARKPLGNPNAVTTSTIVVSEPGSYVLVGPVAVASGDGITINASNVNLDLNGFTISSSSASGDSIGIKLYGDGSNIHNVSIRNGFISGTHTVNGLNGTTSGEGFGFGVSNLPAGATAASNIRVNDVSINGVRDSGIYLYSASGVVSNCSIANVGSSVGSGRGIDATTVTNCTISGTKTLSGIRARSVADCVVEAGNSHVGVEADIVSNTLARGDSTGIAANVVRNSEGYGGSTGIQASRVTESTGFIEGRNTPQNPDKRGISAYIVNNSVGGAPVEGGNLSILADIAVACKASPGLQAPISAPQKHLGTP